MPTLQLGKLLRRVNRRLLRTHRTQNLDACQSLKYSLGLAAMVNKNARLFVIRMFMLLARPRHFG